MTNRDNKQCRPGVSGLLRVKNEAQFLELCVESCIDALDELVIIYQPCTDNSPQIIEKLRRKYPDKIITRFYPHKITSHNLTESEIQRLMALPTDSTELLATYYNTGLNLCSCQHVVKIDADQIYNTERLRKICQAYRATHKVKIKLSERLAYAYLISIAKCNDLLDRFTKKLLSKRSDIPFPIPRYIATKYDQYILKKITNNKTPVSFSGLNLLISPNGLPAISAGKYTDGALPPFNGLNDHIIFPNKPEYYFTRAISRVKHNKYGSCVIEVLNYNNTLYNRFGISPRLNMGGLMWYHLDLLKGSASPNRPMIEINPQRPPSFKSFRKLFDFIYNREFHVWYNVYWKYQSTEAEYQSWQHNLNRIVNQSRQSRQQ